MNTINTNNTKEYLTRDEFYSVILDLKQSITDSFDRIFHVVDDTKKELRSEMNQGFLKVDKRFNDMDQRFLKIDKRFNEIDQRFISVDNRFLRIENKLTDIDEKLINIDERVTNIDERVVNI